MAPILSSDEGYSFTELLVAMGLVAIISVAVMQLILGSQRIYTWAASLEYAQIGARAGLDRIGTDLRWLGSYYSGVAGAGTAITTATATSMTFVGDVDGNTLDSTGNEDTLAVQATAGSTQITVSTATDPSGNAAFGAGGYVYVASGVTREVAKITGVAGTVISLATQLQNTYPIGSLVRSVETVTYTFNVAPTNTITRSVNGGAAAAIVDNVSGLTFTYYDGSNPPVVTATLAQIRQINVSVTVTQPDGSARLMLTRIRPPSLGP